MSELSAVRVYVNGIGVDTTPDATALDAVRTWDAAVAAEIDAGRRALTDSRGLPLDSATQVFNGLIMRVVSKRAARGAMGA